MTEKQIRALQAWAVLTVAAARKETISYGDLCVGLGRDPNVKAGTNTAIPLAAVQNFCREKGKKHLTSIVIGLGTGKPGKGFIKPPNKTVEKCQKEVFAHGKSWFKHHKAFSKWVSENWT